MLLHVIDQQSQWKALEPDWNALLDRTGQVTPFQRPEWLLPWWNHFGSGTLQLLCFREDARLSGLLPLFRHEWNGRRQLTIIGTGLSDWNDPVLPAACVQAVREYLETSRDWDVIDWQDLSAETPLREIGLEVREETPCSAVQLPADFDVFWSSRGKDLRRNVRRYCQKAETQGPVQFEVHCAFDASLFEELVRLHGARWREAGEPGVVASNGAGAFLRETAEAFSRSGILRLFVIRYQGAAVAINLGFLMAGEYFAYLSAFDPEYDSLGFGRQLLYQAFRYCADNGIRVWNFLRGQETYKISWGAQFVPKIRLYKAR